MDFDLLTEIVDSFKTYQFELKNNKRSTLIDFATWIQDHNYPLVNAEFSIQKNADWQQEIEVGISRLLVHLYRYAKIHIRNSMSDFPELVSEDFTYLYTLQRFGSMTKTQLIERNIHEKPTGIEIIKRLLKHKLIMEAVDENDKRSKQLTITKLGEKTFYKTKDITTDIAKLVSGNLNQIEKQTLFQLLKKLDHFHNPIFLTKESKSANTLLIELSMN